MWCTTFAFQPWHSAVEFGRYLARFAHMVSGFNQLHGILRTVYNQYDSMVRPLQAWLESQGVRFELGSHVTELLLQDDASGKRVSGLRCAGAGGPRMITLGSADSVIVTLGSMTEASSLGGTDRAPEVLRKPADGAWALWEKLAAGRPEFGRPGNFDDQVMESKWLSFTTTLRDPTLFRLVQERTGNVPGEGGLITFTDSNWLASIVVPHQPHFIDQPKDVQVLWGYGLRLDEPGNFVPTTLQNSTGREIMAEVLGHLGITAEAPAILDSMTCIPCMMPYITSQFLPRGKGDRPQVRPAGWRNLALVGQFVELPEDVVFTVEYSVRSAQVAAYALLGLPREPPGVYQGKFDPRVLFRAFTALHDVHA
jgi:oleate hydratase